MVTLAMSHARQMIRIIASPLTISGLRTTVRNPEPPGNICLTPAAAIVVTPAPTVIIVTEAGTTVVTVESVLVETPPRVPGVAWAPLRERPGLRLGCASGSQTDKPQPCGNDKCRYSNACNVFHAQFVSLEVPNLGLSGHLISVCNATVMLIFTNRRSPSLLTGYPQNPMGWVRKAQSTPGSVPVARSALVRLAR